jgi:hypothetical protein
MASKTNTVAISRPKEIPSDPKAFKSPIFDLGFRIMGVKRNG